MARSAGRLAQSSNPPPLLTLSYPLPYWLIVGVDTPLLDLVVVNKRPKHRWRTPPLQLRQLAIHRVTSLRKTKHHHHRTVDKCLLKLVSLVCDHAEVFHPPRAHILATHHDPAQRVNEPVLL